LDDEAPTKTNRNVPGAIARLATIICLVPILQIPKK